MESEALFSLEEAAERGTVICNLLSDAGQIALWLMLKECLTLGKTLYFSHGLGITSNDQTNIIPPADVDVILVAPKASGTSLRRLFLVGGGLNSSFAVFQDISGQAYNKAVAVGIGVGSGYLFETDSKKGVYFDLTDERGVLMEALAGIIEAQYQVLRQRGHSLSEAFNETVEELTQSLVPLMGENGTDWMFANCSVTAQRGALDWKSRFSEVALPVLNNLYDSIFSGAEARNTIECGTMPNYHQELDAKLKEVCELRSKAVEKVEAVS